MAEHTLIPRDFPVKQLKRYTCGVYEIRQKSTGKVYIGSSCDIKTRWLEHRRHLVKGVHHSAPLQRAWNKFGESDFTWKIVQRTMRSERTVVEQRLVDSFKSYDFRCGFNVCRIVEHPGTAPMSDECREKLRKRMLGTTLSEEVKRKVSLMAMGNQRTKGKSYGRGILAAADVVTILGRCAAGENPAEIAKFYRIGATAINDIRSGRKWRYVKVPDAIRAAAKKSLCWAKGTNVAFAKLNDDSVRDICLMRQQGQMLNDIAAKYGVHLHTVCLILKGKTWRHVTGGIQTYPLDLRPPDPIPLNPASESTTKVQ